MTPVMLRARVDKTPQRVVCYRVTKVRSAISIPTNQFAFALCHQLTIIVIEDQPVSMDKTYIPMFLFSRH